MDILSKLPRFSNVEDALAVKDQVDEIDEAEAKKERIAFHRAKVRNGPVKFSYTTSGQERRARHRALEATSKKARRKQVRDYLATQRLASVTLGHLQAAGVVEYADDTRVVPEAQVLASVSWLLSRFGEGNAADEAAVAAGLQRALNFWQKATGQPETVIEFA